MSFKGHLCYKTTSSQNVQPEAHIKNFFISWKSDVPFSSNLLVLLNNQLCQVSRVSSFWKGEYRRIEDGKYQLLKIDRSCYIAIPLKS